jgi:hypothetical protein
LSSAFLEKGEVLVINATGLDNDKSFRKANDGFTYFGCKKSIKKIKKGGGATSNQKRSLNVNDKF